MGPVRDHRRTLVNPLRCPTPFRADLWNRHSSSVHDPKCWGCGVELIVFYGNERAWWAAAQFIIEEEPW